MPRIVQILLLVVAFELAIAQHPAKNPFNQGTNTSPPAANPISTSGGNNNPFSGGQGGVRRGSGSEKSSGSSGRKKNPFGGQSGSEKGSGSGKKKNPFGRRSGSEKSSGSSGRRRNPFGRRSGSEKSSGSGGRKGHQGGGCGGRRQPCCAGAQCGGNLKCLRMGDDNWMSMAHRCVRPKARGNCGREGVRCCRKKCLHGLTCAAGKMCRKPADHIVDPTAVGQTFAKLSGWLLVKVRARGGKCFTKVIGNIEVNVQSFGEGTFTETFGSLSGLGECEAGAQGYAIGYIRAEVLASATLGADGACTTDADANIEFGSKVKGDGVSVTLGGNVGANAGCNKRKLLSDSS